MKRILSRLKGKTYFIPTLFCIVALAVTILVALLDRYLYRITTISTLPLLFQTTESVRGILTVLTGALLGMTTVTFSTIMVVLTLYSGQFSPRTLQHFLQGRVSLRVLGVFMGTFIYSVVQLFLLPEAAVQAYSLTGTVGVLAAILCLILFAFFIHHIARSIQVNYVVESITREIFTLLDRKRTLPPRGAPSRVADDHPVEQENQTLGSAQVIYPRTAGYIQHVAVARLVDLATEAGAVIRLERSLGDYVTPDTELFSVWSNQDEPQQVQEEVLVNALTFGEDRNAEEDVEYGIIRLVEVALRALSPGTNDPNTAVFCIQKLGHVLAEIAASKLHRTYYYDQDLNLRLIVSKIPFADLLYQSFAQIRIYARMDYTVLDACIQALVYIARQNTRSIRVRCQSFATYLLEGLDSASIPSLDRNRLDRSLLELDYLTNPDRKQSS